MVTRKKIRRRKNRKKNNSGKLIFFSLIAIVVILTGVYVFLLNVDFTTQNNGQTSNLTGKNGEQTGGIDENGEETNFYIGDKKQLQGELKSTESIGFFTHTLTLPEGRNIGVKSTTINLNNYQGKVTIKGEVTDIKSGKPIIEATEIQPSDKDSLSTGEDTKKEITKKYFGEHGIYFDFEGQTGFDTKTNSDGEIVLEKISSISTGSNASTGTETNGTGDKTTPILSVSSFKCQENSSTKDCENLKERFNKLNFETFVSSNSVKFFQISETNKWMFFNNNLWGYNIYPKGENSVVDVSKYIHTISPEDIESKLSSNISKICQKEDMKIEDIQDTSIYFEDEETKADIEGTDSEGNKISCNLTLKLGETIITELDSIQKTGSVEQENEENNTANSENVKVEIEDEEKLTFESNRDFTMVFPTNDIAYMGTLVEGTENFGINSINCDYKVNASYYKNRDSLESNPGIEVFLCKTQLDSDSLKEMIQGKDLHYKESSSGDKFLIRINNSGLEEVAKNIQIK